MKTSPPNATPSHEFQFAASAVLRLIIPSVIAFAAIVIILRSLNALDWLPAKQAALTGDEFVMKNRFEKADGRDPAEILIIGDSSSVMGVDAATMGRMLPGSPPAYNLGLFLGLPLDVYAEAANRFITRHPGQVRLVVLLTTSSRLADAQPTSQSLAYWRSLEDPAKKMTAEEAGQPGQDVFLAHSFREKFLTRLLPIVAHGEIGVFYGHTVLSRQFLTERAGSAFATGVYNRNGATGKISWAVASEAFAQARRVRELIPTNNTLAYAVMPAPESYATAESAEDRRRVMLALNSSLRAEYLLIDLPATLPDGYFSDLVHLNLRGQEHFTRLLAKELSRLPVWELR